MPRQSTALSRGPAPRDPSIYGQVTHYATFSRGLGTTPRWFDATWPNETLTPGPCTTYPTLRTNTGHTTMRARPVTKDYNDWGGSKRFLQNEAITISLLGLTDPRNPGPGAYNQPRPFGVARRGPPGPQRRRPRAQLPSLGKRPNTAPVPGRDPEIDVLPGNRDLLQQLDRR